MDQRLKERLIKISDQIEVLSRAEEAWLNLKASKDPSFSILYLHTVGAVKEREAQVYATSEWKALSTAMVDSEVEYQKQKRRLELVMKAFDAEYLTYKVENSAINRQGGQT